MMVDKNQDVTKDDIMAMLAGELLPSDIHARRAEKARKRAVGRRQVEIEADLEKHSTRKLMSMRDNLRHHSDRDTVEERNEQEALSYAVYAVLNRRPHVPNKVEGADARRKAARAHHGPKKAGGRRPRFHAPVKLSARRKAALERKFSAWFAEQCKERPWPSNQREHYRWLYRFSDHA